MTTDSELARLYAKAPTTGIALAVQLNDMAGRSKGFGNASERPASIVDADPLSPTAFGHYLTEGDARLFIALRDDYASRLESPAQSEDAMAAALVDSLDGEGRARADGLTSARLAEIVSDGPAACYNDPWAVKQERIELAKEVVFLRHAYHSTAAALDATCEREESERAALATPVGLRPCHHGMNTIECPMCSKALAAPTTHPEGDVVEAMRHLDVIAQIADSLYQHLGESDEAAYTLHVAEQAARAALTPNPTTPQTEAKP